MLRNYFAAAVRNLARNRLHSAITTFSLAVGFAAMIIGLVYANYIHAYDRAWPGAERLYLATQQFKGPKGPRSEDGIPTSLAPVIAAKVPGVEKIARLDYESARLTIGPTHFPRSDIFWVDPQLFELMPRKVIAGDLAAAMADPSATVISQRVAKKYFGDNPAVGQTITVELDGRKVPQTLNLRVGAVVSDLPSQTHFNADGLYISTRSTFAKLDDPDEQSMVYFRVRPGIGRQAVAAALAGLTGPELAPKDGETRRLKALPVIHAFVREGVGFGSNNNSTTRSNGALNVPIFLGLAGLILLTATLNFITLMTARGAGRAVEVGVRKVSGARRRDLIVQFIGEAVLYALLAFVLGLALSELFLPVIRKVGIPDLRLDYGRDFVFVGLLALGAVGMGIVAGLYPALALSSFKPAQVLKGGAAKSPGSKVLRQILVTAQFVPALLLAFGALTIYGQMSRSMENALTMADPRLLAIREECTPFLLDRISALPEVASAACVDRQGTQSTPQTGSWMIGMNQPGVVMDKSGNEVRVRPATTDAEGLKFFDVKFIAGHTFQAVGEPGVIVNQSALKLLGYTDPAAAIGQTVSWKQKDKALRSPIIGVIADRGGFADFEAPMFYLDPEGKHGPGIGVKLRNGVSKQQALNAIEAVWKQSGALKPMESQYYGDWVDFQRGAILQIMGLLGPIAGAGVLIAGLGLFGLAAFLAEQRTKEIGVRKALGAGRKELVQMLVFQFTRPVLIATLIAAPVVFLVMNLLMSRLPPNGRIMPTTVTYVLVLGGAVLIALAATFSHAWRVTGQRPVNALRYE